MSNKGQGYGTKWNVIITTLFFILVFSFLILAGVFVLETNIETVTVLEGKEILNSVQILPEDIIFRAIKSATDKFVT